MSSNSIVLPTERWGLLSTKLLANSAYDGDIILRRYALFFAHFGCRLLVNTDPFYNQSFRDMTNYNTLRYISLPFVYNAALTDYIKRVDTLPGSEKLGKVTSRCRSDMQLEGIHQS